MHSHRIPREIVTSIALSMLTVVAGAAATGPVRLKSPNGSLDVSIATVEKQTVQPDAGQLAYSVSFRNKPLLEWSNLGLAFEGAPTLGSAVRIDSSDSTTHDETWKSVQGKANPIRDHYNAVTVQAVDTAAGGARIAVEFRAYDDGV